MPPSQLLAKTGGILTKSRISNYEQGLRRLGPEEAHMLAEALGTVSATYLLYLDDEGFSTGPERDLVRFSRQTDRRGRATILGVANSQCGVPVS